MQPLVERAFDYILVNEGGWSNHAKDKGGATNLGVTIKTFRKAAAEMAGHDFDLDDDGDVDADDLRNMERPLAIAIFEKYYWQDNLGLLEDRVAIKTADYGFNAGPMTGVKLLQRSINLLADERGVPRILVDGKLGKKTAQMANLSNVEDLLEAMQTIGKQFYRDIVERDPTQRVWLNGWINRAMRLP